MRRTFSESRGKCVRFWPTVPSFSWKAICRSPTGMSTGAEGRQQTPRPVRRRPGEGGRGCIRSRPGSARSGWSATALSGRHLRTSVLRRRSERIRKGAARLRLAFGATGKSAPLRKHYSRPVAPSTPLPPSPRSTGSGLPPSPGLRRTGRRAGRAGDRAYSGRRATTSGGPAAVRADQVWPGTRNPGAARTAPRPPFRQPAMRGPGDGAAPCFEKAPPLTTSASAFAGCTLSPVLCSLRKLYLRPL